MGLRIAGRVWARLPGFLVGRKREEAEEAEGGLEVRPKPVGRSVRWSPVEMPEFDRPTDRLRPFELFVCQPVIRNARSGLTGTGERFGFLLGKRFWCPESRSPWVLLSEATPPAATLPARGEEREFGRLRLPAEKEAAGRGLELVGWYHEHRYLGVALTPHEVTLHSANFPEPWQCVLIFVPGPGGSSGAFIQPWRGERHFGRALVSFQEVVEPEDGAARGQHPPFSTVDWSNYVPERPVERGERLVLDGEPAAGAAEPEPEAGPTVAFRLHSRVRAGEPEGRPPLADPDPSPAEPRPPLRLDVPLLLPPSEPLPLRQRIVAWVRGLVTRI